MPHPSAVPAGPEAKSLGRVSLPELLREQAEREEAPGEVEVAREEEHGSRPREVAGERGRARRAPRRALPPLLAVEVDRERLDRAVVDPELAVRIAARGEQQQRPAAGLVQLALRELDSAGEIGEDGSGSPSSPASSRSSSAASSLTPALPPSLLDDRAPARAGSARRARRRSRRSECAPTRHERRPDERRPDRPRAGPAPEERDREATMRPRIMCPLGNESSNVTTWTRAPSAVP